MPRYARRVVPGAIVHLISRVVDRELRIDDGARAEYLRRVARVAPRAKWGLLAYALMSNHVHWLLHCLGAPVRDFIHPLHSGFGRWLNRRDKRLTPVFAERPKTYLFEPHEAPRLIAYIHNNPVRAEVAASATESAWTSHRAYIGTGAAPSWLDVETGLACCGLTKKSADRRVFDGMVEAVANAPRDPLYDSDRMSRARRQLRRRLNAPVELATPTVTDDHVAFPLVAASVPPLCERWDGSMHDVVERAARTLGVPLQEVLSPAKSRRVSNVRRLVMLVACIHLGRTKTEASAALGLSLSAGSRLLSRSPDSVRVLEPLAAGLAQELL